MGTFSWSRDILKSSGVEWAFDAEAGFGEDVGVDLGGGNVGVAEEFLDGANIVAGFEQVGGEGVATATC